MATFKNRRTGTTVEVDTAEAFGLDAEGGKWVTSCVTHGTLVNSATKSRAMAAGRYPDFCDDCSGRLCWDACEYRHYACSTAGRGGVCNFAEYRHAALCQLCGDVYIRLEPRVVVCATCYAAAGVAV